MKMLQGATGGDTSTLAGDEETDAIISAGRRASRRRRVDRTARRVHVPDVDAQARDRRDQRRGRGHGRADRARLRPALHEPGRRPDDLVRAARPDRRVGNLLAARPARRTVGRARPPVLGAQGLRGRGGAARSRQPRPPGRRGRPGRSRLPRRAGPELLADVDRHDEAAGVPRPAPRPRLRRPRTRPG